MSILVDWQIQRAIKKKEIKVEPFDPTLVNPSSLDIRLGKYFTVTEPVEYNFFQDPVSSNYIKMPVLDPLDKNSFKSITKKFDQLYFFPGKTILVSMLEHLELFNNISAKVFNKSSIARLGIDNCASAGWIDPGWKGIITLELTNTSNYVIKLTEGMKIGQIIFFKHEKVNRGYEQTGRYLNQLPGQGSKGV